MARLLVEVSKDEGKPWGAEEGERIPLSKPWAFGSPKTRNRSGMFSDAGALFYSLFVKEPGPAGGLLAIEMAIRIWRGVKCGRN